jgi:CBS domain containing-hemolysin-like protein
MVPRGRVYAADLNTPFDELLPRLAASPYTRVPIYDGTLDRLVGIVNTKQLALRQLTGRMPQQLSELMRPAVTVPETMTGDRLIATFREKRTHQAIAIDAQQRVVGIVSLDDLLTDLLGAKDEAPGAAAPPSGATGGATGGASGGATAQTSAAATAKGGQR